MTNNALLIYNQLRASGLSEAGALGLMGNWMAESGLEPGRLQGDFTQGRTYSRAYTDDVASGRIGRSQFGRDQKGYGLAQWTYYTRKEDLYDFWNSSSGPRPTRSAACMSARTTTTWKRGISTRCSSRRSWTRSEISSRRQSLQWKPASPPLLLRTKRKLSGLRGQYVTG